MLCNEFDVRLQSLLDERKPPELDPHLLSHARQCSDCHGQMATLGRFLDSLDLVDMPDLSPGFAQRVVDSVLRHTKESLPKRSPSTWAFVAAAVAAALLLAAIPFAWRPVGDGPEIAQPIHKKQPFANPNTNSLEFVPSDGGGWMVSSTIFELYPEETRQRHRQQVNQIADDLRPIATPFNAAMTAIRRSIPVGRSPTKGEPRASIDRPILTLGIS